MLDPTGRKEVLKTISKLNKELNMTVVLITHYMSETVRADRILVMKDGDIILEGTPREVFSKPEVLSSAGLDVPQSAELMYELKKEGINVPSGVIEIEECVEEILKLL
jgi:energy-coupling factor transport system ATP-binding protein